MVLRIFLRIQKVFKRLRILRMFRKLKVELDINKLRCEKFVIEGSKGDLIFAPI